MLNGSASLSSRLSHSYSEADNLKLIHELEVHQIELIMQNEELILAKERAVELATEKYADLYDFAPSGYFTLSVKGEITELNLCTSMMLGNERKFLLNKPFASFVSVETRPIFDSFLEETFAGKIRAECDISLSTTANVPLYIHLIGTATNDGSQCLGTAVDITERKKSEQEILGLNANLEFRIAERTYQLAESNAKLEQENAEHLKTSIALQESLDRLNKIADRVPGVVYQYRLNPDRSSCFPYASNGIHNIFHVSPNQVIHDASAVLARLHPDDSEGVAASIMVSARDLVLWLHEYRVIFDDGTVHWLSGNAMPMQEADGSVLWHGFITDITGRKQAEDELKLVSSRLALATRAGGVGVWDYDIASNTLAWDHQMFALYGIKKEDFGGAYEAWQIGLHPDDAVRGDAEIQMAIRGEKEFNTEFRVVWPNGTIRNIRALATLHRDESGNPKRLIGTNWDITAQKHTEESISLARNEAEKANQAKSEFLSRMSHELRSPMNSILGFAQLLNISELNPRQMKGVHYILSSGKHLLNLIDEVLDISHIESGRVTLLPEPVQLNGIIEEIMDMFHPLTNTREIKLELEESPANQLFVMADRKRLKQVLINLLSNAVKYNRHGGSIIVKTETVPQTDASIFSVRISVTDTGFGIPPEGIPKLFTPFERIGAENSEAEGTGLGLAIVKKLMEAMDGEVGVNSIVDQGSTFWIELPTTEKQISWKNQHEDNIKLTAELVVANKEIAFQNEEIAFQNEQKSKRAEELIVYKRDHSRENEVG
jgi:PAS domain S-box-containing protein